MADVYHVTEIDPPEAAGWYFNLGTGTDPDEHGPFPTEQAARDAMPRYELDGEYTTLSEFFAANQFEPDHQAEILAKLKAGEEVRFGGGAMPITVLRRVQGVTRYAIERQYLLPVFHHLIVEVPAGPDALDRACRSAIDNDDWPEAETKQDFDSAWPTTVVSAVVVDEQHRGDEDATWLLYEAGLPGCEIPDAYTDGERHDRAAELMREALRVIAGGDGDAQEIALQTLNELMEMSEPRAWP